MTLVLELPPSVEASLQERAHAAGIPVEEYAREVLRRDAAGKGTSPRRAAALRGFGKFAGRGSTVDEFLREKHEDVEREEERYQERQAAKRRAA